MKDTDLKIVCDIVGDVILQQRGEIDLRIKSVQDILEGMEGQFPKLSDFDNAIIEIGEIKSSIESSFSNIDQKQKELAAACEAVDVSFKDLRERIDEEGKGYIERISAVSDNISNSIADNNIGLDDRHDNLLNKFVAIDNSIFDITKSINESNKRINDSIDASISDIMKSIESITSEVKHSIELVSVNKDKTDESIKSAIDGFNDKISSISNNIVQFKEFTESVMADHDNKLKDDIDEIREEITDSIEKISAALETLREAGENTAEIARKGVVEREEKILGILARLDAIDALEPVLAEKGDKGERGDQGRDGIDIRCDIWNKGVYREGHIVQHFLGRVYIAVKDTADEPGDSEDWKRVGTCGIRWRGIKSDDIVYEDGDEYIHDGSTFRVFNGKAHMVAKRGSKGDKGDRGDPGLKGDKGDKGEDGISVISVQMSKSGIDIVMSNGDMYSADYDTIGINQYVKALLDFDRESQPTIDQPVSAYRGIWKRSESYARGDLVNDNKSLYLCKNNVQNESITTDNWVRIASSSSSGSGGTSSARVGSRIAVNWKTIGPLSDNATNVTIAEQDFSAKQGFNYVVRLNAFGLSITDPGKMRRYSIYIDGEEVAYQKTGILDGSFGGVENTIVTAITMDFIWTATDSLTHHIEFRLSRDSGADNYQVLVDAVHSLFIVEHPPS